MTDPTHNPDPLGAATDRLIIAIVGLVPRQRKAIMLTFGAALSDWVAELINRAAAQSARAVVVVNDKVDALGEQVAALERRERARGARLDELQRTVNGQIDAVYQHMPPDLTEAVTQLAMDIERLKERQAGDVGAE